MLMMHQWRYMTAWTPRLLKLSTIETLAQDRHGGVLAVFAISFPLLFGAVGLTLDYGNAVRLRSNLQNVADQAALTAARELRLGNSNDTTVAQIASNFVRASLTAPQSMVNVTSSVSTDRASLTVSIVQTVDTILPQQLGLPFTAVHVNARARVFGGAPLCLLALDTAAATGIGVSLSSNISANACTVYSNSKSTTGLAASDTSRVSALRLVRGAA